MGWFFSAGTEISNVSGISGKNMIQHAIGVPPFSYITTVLVCSLTMTE